jgi:hypothetical protein
MEWAGQDLTALTPPPMQGLAGQQVVRLLEDLALCGDALARLLRQTSGVVGRTTGSTVTAGNWAAYWTAVRNATLLLQRAEEWLRTIDHETGLHETLPGYEGGNVIEEQLHIA